MDSSRILKIVLQLQDDASQKLGNISNALKSDQVKKGADIVAAGFLAVGAAAVGASIYSVKMASDFQSAMTLIQTQAGASAKEVDYMSQAILNLAPVVGSTPKDLANALFYIESAGYHGAKALDILKLSAEGAKVGQADLGDTAKAVTSILNSHIKGVKDASDAMGQMNAIVGAGKMKMEDLNAALSSGILASAKSFGLSLKDVGAALDTMTNAGVPAQDAATRLRMTFSLMEAPTAKAQKALESIGMSSRQMADDMRKGGLIDALDDLNKHMNAVQPATETVIKSTKMTATQLTTTQDRVQTLTARIQSLSDAHVKGADKIAVHNAALKTAQDQLAATEGKLTSANSKLVTFGGGMLDATQKAQLMSDMFGGGRTSSAMLTLINNMDQVKDRFKQVSDTSNNFAASWQKTQGDNAVAMDKLKATLATLAIEWGNILLPIVTRAANYFANNLIPIIQNVTGFFEKHRLATIALAAVLSGLLLFGILAVGIAIWTSLVAPTVAFIGFVLTVAIPAAVAFAIAFAPFILIGIAIAGAALLIITHWKQITSLFNAVKATISQFATDAMRDISGVVKNIQTAFTNFGSYLSGTFGPAIADVFNVITFPLKLWWDLNVLEWAGIQKLMQMFGSWFEATFGKQIQAVFNFIKQVVVDYVNMWVDRWNFVKNLVTTVWNDISNTTTTASNGIFNYISTVFTNVLNFMDKNFLTPLSNVWKNVWNGVSTFTQNIVSSIWSAIKGMINNIIGGINNMISGFDKLGGKLPGFIQLPTIPMLASGTNFFQGGLAMVGEQGPELVNLPRGSQVIPNNKINNYNNNASVQVGPVYVSDISDMNMLAQRLDFLMKTSGRY